MGRLDGKVAIVTGAGRGIGREYALTLAREGARVVVNDLGAELEGGGQDVSPADGVVAEIEALGGTAIANHADVADYDAAGRAVRAALDAFGSVDILIANAAIVRRGPIVECSEETWDRVLGTNLKGTYNFVHHAARVMTQQGSGSILTITSGGSFGPSPRSAPYATSKGAILSFTLCAAAELAPSGVTVNCLSPGLTATRLGKGAVADITKSFGITEEDFYADVGAPQRPYALAGLAAFLVSDEARAINGRIFEVAGDRIVVVNPPTRGETFERAGGWKVEDVFADFPRSFED
jgi:NAD(P)-dependent dehydrogenase (short-subunit alcohol dehydrogenase family)